MLRAALSRLLNGTFLAVFLLHEFVPENIVLSFLAFALRDIALSVPYLNQLLNGGPILLRRARLRELSFALRASTQPFVVTLSGVDIVLLLNSKPPLKADGNKSWNIDVLFLDMMYRLAKRSAGLDAMRAQGVSDARVPELEKALSWKQRWAFALLNWLVQVHLTEVAVHFEDAQPHVLYRNLAGYGFSITVTIDSIDSSPQASDERLGDRGTQRVAHMKGLCGYFDPGVAKTVDGTVASKRNTATSEGVDEESVPALSYVGDGYYPFLHIESMVVSARLDSSTQSISARFMFDAPVKLSLSDLEFQAGLASILRIPNYMLSKLARGAVEELRAPQGLSASEVLAGLSQSTRRRYLERYKQAVATRMKNPAATELARLERTLSLSECLALRDWCEAVDLDDLVASAVASGDVDSKNAEALVQAFATFSTRLSAAETGVGGFAANQCWGNLDAEADQPAMVLLFEFRFVALEMLSSDPAAQYRSERLRHDAARMTIELRDSQISVYDTFGLRGALVVELLVPSILGRLDDSHVMLRSRQCIGGKPFMAMRFRKDGLLSPALQSMRLGTKPCDVFLTGEQLRFILDYFVPIETPLSNALRRRCLKTIAVARRNRASKSDVNLPLRSSEQAAVLEILLESVDVYSSEVLVNSSFFLNQLASEGVWNATAPSEPTLRAHFDSLSIETCLAPTHKFTGDGLFSLDCSPVPGAILDTRYDVDPGDKVSGEHAHIDLGDGVRTYDGSIQVAAFRLSIRGISVDIITPESRIRVTYQAVVRQATIDMVVLYIGMPYSRAYRVDNYLDVSLGAQRGVRLLAKSLPILSSLIEKIVSPVVHLSALLAASMEPWAGLSCVEVLTASANAAYIDMNDYGLEWVDSLDVVRRTVRRVTGDTHVRLRQARVVFVQSVGKVYEPPSSGSLRRAFLDISFHDSYVRSLYYASGSSRIVCALHSLSLDISRGEASVRRMYIVACEASLSVILGPSIGTSIQCSTGPIETMAQTASTTTLLDLVSIVKAMTPNPMTTGDDCSEVQQVFVGSKQRLDFPEEPHFRRKVDDMEVFVMSVSCMSPDAELGRLAEMEDSAVGLVSRGLGLQWHLMAAGRTYEEEWKFLRVASDPELCLFVDSNAVVGVRPLQTSMGDLRAAIWRFVGDDTRHLSLQNASGHFLSVNGLGGSVVLSRIASYFCLGRDWESNTFGDQLGTTLVVSVPKLSLKFGGGGLASPRTAGQHRNATAPGLLQIDIENLGLKAEQLHSSKEPRWNFDGAGTLSLSYNDLARRNSAKISVLSPWQVAVSGGQGFGDQLVKLHGNRLRVKISDILLQKIALSLRHHGCRDDDDKESDELSFFTFLNCTDRNVWFRVHSDDHADDGPITEVRALGRRPFNLPESSFFSAHVARKREEEESHVFARHKTIRNEVSTDESDHGMSIHLDGYLPVTCRFGRAGLQKLKLVSESGVEKHSNAAYLRVVEEERRGSIRLELVLPVALKNHLPVSIDIYDDKRQFHGRVPAVSKALEYGLSLPAETPLSFAIGGLSLTPDSAAPCTIANVLGSLKKSSPHLDLVVAPDAKLPLECSGYRIHITANATRRAQCVLSSSEEDTERRILHFAPVVRVENRLASSFDVVLDDGVHHNSLQKLAPKWVSELFTGSIGAATFVLYAAGVKPGQIVAFMETSLFGKYRVRISEDSSSWSESVSFSVSNSPSPGRFEFREAVSTSRGVIDVTGHYDEHLTMTIVLAAKYIVRNFTGRPFILASSTITASLGRLANHQNTVAVQDFAYYDEAEAVVGVRGDWSKFNTNFPKVGEREIVRIPSSKSPSRGLQFVVLATSATSVVFRPLIEVQNLLSVSLRLDGFPKARNAPLVVHPSKSAAFHEPHQMRDSVLHSGGSRKLKITMDSIDNFEKTGVLVLDAGIHSLAVLRTQSSDVSNAKGLTTNSRYMIVGLECRMEETGNVLRVLDTPIYGPALAVSNFSRFTVHLSADENVPEPICRVLPGGDVASFAWTTINSSKRRSFFVSLLGDQSLSPSVREVLMPCFDGPGSEGPEVRLTIPYFASVTGSPLPVSLLLRFARGNGFMATLRILEKEKSAEPLCSAELAESVTRTSLALHVALPRVTVSVSDLLSLSMVGLSGSMMRTSGESTGRMEVGASVYGIDLKNTTRKPWFPVILTRATRGRSVDDRSPLVSVQSTTRLPNTALNPSNLLHFETCKVLLQPIVLNLESRFLDRAGMYFVRLLSDLRTNGQASNSGVALQSPVESINDEGLPAVRRTPLYFEGDVLWSNVIVNLTFTNNGRIRVGLVREDTPMLSSLIRVLIVSALPPVKNAHLRFAAPDVSYRVFLAGELSQEVMSSLGKQTLTILRQLIPNVALLTAIEVVVRGRRKGDEQTRRLGRAKALAKRAAAHLAPDNLFYQSHVSVPHGGGLLRGGSSGSGSDSGVRYASTDTLADLLEDVSSSDVRTL